MEKDTVRISLSETALDALKTARDAAGALAAGAGAQTFRYGWCRTDHKDGSEIRSRFRECDYVFDEPYASRVAAMLRALGLPPPSPAQVFRGTHHDLLFIDSHGVVLRIGPADMHELINPAILQPLGWLQDDETAIRLGLRDCPLTVAVYPGVEIYDRYITSLRAQHDDGRMERELRASGQRLDDIEGHGNTGVICVPDAFGAKKAVRVVIDTDNAFNGTDSAELERRQHAIAQITALVRGAGLGQDAAMGAAIGGLFNAVATPWHRAQAAHQPLRSLFWGAFDSAQINQAAPDPARRDAFWHACALAARKDVRLPATLWRMKKNPDGSQTLDCRQEMTDVRLYTTWTGQKADQPAHRVHPQDFIHLVANALRAAGQTLRMVAAQAGIGEQSRSKPPAGMMMQKKPASRTPGAVPSHPSPRLPSQPG